jgi:uncharacterized protein YndB with AHSA1/START domain
MMTHTAQVSMPSDHQVSVSRTFQAPRDLVYKAYADPELFRRWCGALPGWTMPVCEMDVRVGGKFRWVWRSEEHGQQFGFHGEYRRVEAPTRIVHTEAYDPGTLGGSMTESGEALIDVSFEERDGVTTVVTVMDYGSKEARDAAVATGMTDGMEQSYQFLDELLAKGAVA